MAGPIKLWLFPLDSSVSGPSSDLFSGVLYHGYNPPPGFCWDTLCTDDPIMVRVFLYTYIYMKWSWPSQVLLWISNYAKCKIVWRIFSFINKLDGFFVFNKKWNMKFFSKKWKIDLVLFT